MGEHRIDVRYPELHDPEWLQRRHIDERADVAEIAEEVGSSEEMVRRALRRHRIARAPDEDFLRSDTCPELSDEEWLRRAYLEHGMTGAAIAELLGCRLGDVYRALRRLNIGPKTPSKTSR